MECTLEAQPQAQPQVLCIPEARKFVLHFAEGYYIRPFCWLYIEKDVANAVAQWLHHTHSGKHLKTSLRIGQVRVAWELLLTTSSPGNLQHYM